MSLELQYRALDIDGDFPKFLEPFMAHTFASRLHQTHQWTTLTGKANIL